LVGPGFAVEALELGVPGRFNVDNASLALGLVVGLVSREWRLGPQFAGACAARGIAGYRGSLRRFEPWGEVGGIPVIHDYAHHPTEVRVTLEAARRVFPGRPLHVLFQPHQHSRTARFLDDFVASLRGAERVVVSDVYGARAHIDGENLAGAPELVGGLIASGVAAVHGGERSSSARAAIAGLTRNCALLVLGAGDIVDVKDELLEQLAHGRARERGSVV
jgi:UDP-N-acetylmuramate--alanine ligase